MNPVDVKYSTYIDFDIQNNDKGSKFKDVDHVKIWKIKSIFGKVYAPNWREDAFAIEKVKDVEHWPYVIEELNGEEFIGMLYENELKKTNKTICEIGRLWSFL